MKVLTPTCALRTSNFPVTYTVKGSIDQPPLPDTMFVISSILPASDRDAERERERRDSCVCELVYLHLRVTTNNEDLSSVI